MPLFKISGYSRSSVPDMTVTFENGVSHDMLLEPYSDSPCNFIGTLKNQPSSLAVTGCLKKPGDKMHITLLSDLNTKHYLYEVDYEGHVTAEENPFKYQTGLTKIDEYNCLLLLLYILFTEQYFNKCKHNYSWCYCN